MSNFFRFVLIVSVSPSYVISLPHTMFIGLPVSVLMLSLWCGEVDGFCYCLPYFHFVFLSPHWFSFLGSVVMYL